LARGFEHLTPVESDKAQLAVGVADYLDRGGIPKERVGLVVAVCPQRARQIMRLAQQ
jgi:hypothetical protein